MIFAKKQRIDEYIIEILNEGSLEGPDLLNQVKKYKSIITKQALYKSLRQLVESEVITKTGKKFSLNRFWLQKIYQFAKRHINNVGSKNILEFEDGESLTYHFKNPYLLDITWLHFYDMVYEENPHDQVILDYQSHEWPILVRPDTEKYWINRFNKEKRLILISIGGNTVLDKKFKKDWNSEFVHINTGVTYGINDNKYISVIGDYIFEVTIDIAFSKQVNLFFEKESMLTEDSLNKLKLITQKRYKSKLNILRNKHKADIWRKKFKNDFYIPKGYIF